MLAHRVVQAQQLRAIVKHGGGHVINGSGGQPSYRHVELEIRNLQHRATHERTVTKLAFNLVTPGAELVGRKCLARLALLLGVANAQHGRDRMTQLFDGTHQRFVLRRLEGIRWMKSMLTPDEHEDGVGLRKRQFAWHLENGHRAEGHDGLHGGPVAAPDAYVLEINAGQVQCDAALLAAAACEVEVNQSWLAHETPRMDSSSAYGTSTLNKFVVTAEG